MTPIIGDQFVPKNIELPPSVQRYRDYARQRQLTLGDLLLENRIIFLAGVINDISAIEIVMKMLYLQYENRTQDIHFYIEMQAREIEADRHKLNVLLAKHTGQSIEVIAKETERDRYFSAEDAKTFGLVDDILSKPPVDPTKK